VYSTSDFRKGLKILFRDEPYMILEYQLVKPGKGGTFLRTKMKNMLTGLTHEETFRSTEKFAEPNLAYKTVAYLYVDNDLYNFMDQETYEEISIEKDHLDEVLDYLKEQEVYTVLYFNGKPISVTPPMFMELKIMETTPGVKGDTAQGAGSKPAKLETGLVLQIPLFVNEGDIIKVDTRDNKYIERIK
jgi:elongation factor P